MAINAPEIPMGQALSRLRAQFPGMEIHPEPNGAPAVAAKHDGEWRAWWFNTGITDLFLKSTAESLRKWRGER